MAYFERGSNNNRESWRFAYQGHELAAAAKSKLAFYSQAEGEARQEIAALLQDPNVSTESHAVEKARSRVEANAKEREACAVFVTEFDRNPTREYQLAIGDVIYFGLVTV